MKSITGNSIILYELALSDRYRFFIFDLDDTLYPEKSYLFPAYAAIAEYLAENYDLNKDELQNFLLADFEKYGRNDLFNRLCARFDIPDNVIGGMLKILRTIKVSRKIELFAAMRAFMQELIRRGKKIGVITNGNPQQQENKIKSIQWHGLDRHIEFVLAASIIPKPDTAAFTYLINKVKALPVQSIYVGDNDVDELFARNCGIDFLNVNEILGNTR